MGVAPTLHCVSLPPEGARALGAARRRADPFQREDLL